MMRQSNPIISFSFLEGVKMGNDKYINCASCWNYFYENFSSIDKCSSCEKEGGDESSNVPTNWTDMNEE